MKYLSQIFKLIIRQNPFLSNLTNREGVSCLFIENSVQNNTGHVRLQLSQLTTFHLHPHEFIN